GSRIPLMRLGHTLTLAICGMNPTLMVLRMEEKELITMSLTMAKVGATLTHRMRGGRLATHLNEKVKILLMMKMATAYYSLLLIYLMQRGVTLDLLITTLSISMVSITMLFGFHSIEAER